MRHLLHVVELVVVVEDKSITTVKILAGSPILVINLTHACPTSRVTDLVNGSHGDSAKSRRQERNHQYCFPEISHDRLEDNEYGLQGIEAGA
jgi:ribosomal protein L14E/L6E/L27E